MQQGRERHDADTQERDMTETHMTWQGQEWTNEEDMQVMLHLRNIRQGHLSQKNMTVREAEKIQDVLKVSTSFTLLSCPPLRNIFSFLADRCIGEAASR